MTAAIRHLLVEKGTDWSYSFQFKNAIVTKRSAITINTPVTIQLTNELIDPLPAGFVLEFRTIDGFVADGVLTEPAAEGATAIVVTLTNAIPENSFAQTTPISLAGCSARSWAREFLPNGPIIAMMTCSIVDSYVDVGQTSSVSELLIPNCTWQDFQDAPRDSLGIVDLNDPEAQALKVWRKVKACWDLEVVDPQGKVMRSLQGKFFISAEATHA